MRLLDPARFAGRLGRRALRAGITAGSEVTVTALTAAEAGTALGLASGVVAAQRGALLLGPATAVPGRALRAAAQAPGRLGRALASSPEGLAGSALASLVDPRAGRRQRRVQVREQTAVIEVRGMKEPVGETLTKLLDEAFPRATGVDWWLCNAVTGCVAIGFDPAERTVPDLIGLVREAETAAGCGDATWSRHVDLPGDREPLVAAGLALAGDLVGLAVAYGGRGWRLPAFPRAASAVVALVDAQPRVRRLLEGHLGLGRTDLLLAAANAAANAASHDGAALLVDAGQRALAVVEHHSRHQAWTEWERRLHGPDGIAVPDPLDLPVRPRAMPDGPIEVYADRAAAGSLVAALLFLGRHRTAGAAEAVLAGVPKAARTSRESFASTFAATMAGRGVLTLDSGVWRRFDRASALVVDSSALVAGRPLVLDARGDPEGWPAAQVWSAAQRLLGATAPSAGLRLSPAAPVPGTEAWHDLVADGLVVGRALVGEELHPRADAVLAAARRAGLRIVLSGDASTAELRGRADELVPARTSMTGVVRRLQEDGHMVAVLSRDGYRALASSDIGIGLARPASQGGAITVPWSADLVCDGLEPPELLFAAVPRARAVSERGRTLALSASLLGGLLMVSGRRRRLRLTPGSPVNAAALVGLMVGTAAGWTSGRARPPAAGPLVPWHALDPDEVLARLPSPGGPPDPSPAVLTGALVPLAAAARQLAGHPLLVPAVEPARAVLSVSRHVREELADPLTPVLSVGAAASAILGSATDAVLVGSVLGVNAVVSGLQRERADSALRDLLLDQRVPARRLTGPEVRRLDTGWDSPAEEPVAGDDLLPGDVIALRPGDVVPADARLLAVEDLEVDESGLTGESVTVDKQVGATPGAPLHERACMVYEGSTVLAGRGRAVVVAVGTATQAGRAVAAVGPGTGSVGVQAQLHSLTAKTLPLTVAGGALVAALALLRGQSVRAALTDGVAIAVAAVPEGLPLVATVAQLAAARRLSRRGVLVRSSRTVEALGRVDTACFDKTGTLTEGRLVLVALADFDRTWTPAAGAEAPDARRLLRAAARACPQREDGPVLHATDRAVLDAADRHLGLQAVHVWDPVEEMPFESNRGYAATLGQTRRTLRLVVKGAPEVVLPQCSRALGATEDATGRTTVRFGTAERTAADRVVHDLAAQGLRVLVVARRDLVAAPQDMAAAVEQLTLVGFVGLADTPRPETVPVVRALQGDGVDVRMITGDHPVTARAIAEQLGIAGPVTTGADLEERDDSAQRTLIDRSRVFARVTPEQKVRIVEALQQSGHVVAMAGDGSNDAAAIRKADVGIGLAAHGSAAARNAADLVLLEPDLTLLLDALVEGRSMWTRVRDAVAVLVGGNAGEVVFTLLGTAVSGRAPVTTRQLLLVNLLTDMFPAMAVALAHARRVPDTDHRQAPGQRVADIGRELAQTPRPELGRALMRSIVVRGTVTATAATGAWTLGRATGRRRRASTMGLVALVGTQLGQTALLGGHSPLVWITVLGSGAVLIAVVQTPVVCRFFGCTPLGPVAWSMVGLTAGTATLGSVLLPRLAPMASHVVRRARSAATVHPVFA